MSTCQLYRDLIICFFLVVDLSVCASLVTLAEFAKIMPKKVMLFVLLSAVLLDEVWLLVGLLEICIIGSTMLGVLVHLLMNNCKNVVR